MRRLNWSKQSTPDRLLLPVQIQPINGYCTTFEQLSAACSSGDVLLFTVQLIIGAELTPTTLFKNVGFCL